jgi:PAS domain S-box-containing protein
VKGRITYVNDKFCEISKYSRAELLGQDHRIINSGFHPKEFIRDLWQTISSGRIWRGEIRNRAKDGSIYWVDTTIVPFLDDDGRPYQYMAIRYDITERKQAEDRLREQAALARLGEMAAVVAHEVKNPLAGIRGALQVIGGRLPEASRDRAIMGDIVARLDSLNNIVQDLLVFARPSEPKLGPVPLADLVEQTAALLKKDPAHAGVDVRVTGDRPLLQADAAQLQTVFLNLLLNAAQASGAASDVQVRIACAGGQCRIEVSDRGPGVPPDMRARMFEPFFTTKHRGTGLGLPTAKRVIERHSGTIEILCPDGGGTTVVVTLPVT